ncbi:riboflavin synthase [Salinarchaeum chitinilyticum]
MYTGIVETTGRLRTVDRHQDGDASVRIETELDGIDPDDSVAVDGVCLTATAVGEDWFDADLSAETVSRTYLADRSPGEAVNLERPLPADGRFHGHVVKGTVDTVTELLRVTRDGEGWRYELAIPPEYADLVVEKGAVALDGASLTVADVDRRAGTFAVAVVPQTRSVTTLDRKAPGDLLHFEADVLAKYARGRAMSGGGGGSSGPSGTDSENGDDSNGWAAP